MNLAIHPGLAIPSLLSCGNLQRDNWRRISIRTTARSGEEWSDRAARSHAECIWKCVR